MVSQIDPTKPTTGNALTADVRANFQTAANEITALQASISSGTLSGFLQSLDSLAGVGVLKKTGPGASAALPSTTYGEGLLNQASAGVAQAYLGLLSAATHAASDFAAVQHNHTATEYVTMVGDTGSGGTKGAVPTPQAGSAGFVLFGNGTWKALQGTLGGAIAGAGNVVSNVTLQGYNETLFDNGNCTGSASLTGTNGTYQRAILTGNCNFTFTGLAPTGRGSAIILVVQQDGTGGRTASFSGVRWNGGTAPVVSAAAGSITVLTFVSFNIGGVVSTYGFTAGLAMA